ncbi:MAG: Gfo/Idh/MocA family oxidoreductase [Clostridium sp.]|nr:Gfo/Idh/MocA family oxidoreductase [Clostridium sp.]MCM1547750.1 Gfo/Idh/MocA family oxidoreductase [Ruminococcus sp.]
MNVGILGIGSIAHKMASTIDKMKNASVMAAASRNIEKARSFSEKYGIKKYYGSYEELAKDDELDLIYIATPHSRHFEDCMLCLENKRNVLCEKSFTANAEQADKALKYAEKNNLFISEAMWTRFMPMRFTLEEIISSGVIGSISSLTANLGYSIANKERIVKPEFAGGALLDLGVYTLNFAVTFFGHNITDIKSSCIKNSYGVDLHNTVILTFDDNKTAILHSNAVSNTDRRAIIYGDKGRIEIENINNYKSISVILNDGTVTVYDSPAQISGYEYEAEASLKAVSEKKTQCSEMPHSETLFIMRLMDDLRNEWKIKYPFE